MRPQLSEPFVARIMQDSDGRWRAQSLLDHLVNTGELAAAFAQPFGADAWARLASSTCSRYVDGWGLKLCRQQRVHPLFLPSSPAIGPAGD